MNLPHVPEQAQSIVVDSRETNSRIPAHLRDLGVDFVMQEMPAGDYRVGAFLIERKSIADLATSILDARLFAQAEAIALAAERPALLIEGNIQDLPNDMHPDSLPGAISALSVFWGLSVFTAPNQMGTARLLARLHHHQVNGLGYEVATRVAKPKDSPDGALAQYLVCGLPGVGPEVARKLIAHFGSARAVFAASAAELVQCKGIGPKTAAAIVASLDQMPTSFRSTKYGTL
jgi:ERCC4-type nuclease